MQVCNLSLFVQLMRHSQSRGILLMLLDFFFILTSFLISFQLIVSKFEFIKGAMLIALLINNCYWMTVMDTFSRVRKILSSSQQSREQRIEPRINQQTKSYSNPDNIRLMRRTQVQQFQQRNPSGIAGDDLQYVLPRSSLKRLIKPNPLGLPIQTAPNFINSSKQFSFNNSLNPFQRQSNISFKQIFSSKRSIQNKNLSFEKRQNQQKEISKRQQQFQQTLTKLRISKQAYQNSISKIKMSFFDRIKSLIKKHYSNIQNINEILNNVFNKSLVETNQAHINNKTSLDQIIDIKTYDPQFLGWTWTRMSNEKRNVLAHLMRLIDERVFIDKHLIFNKSHHKSFQRQQAIRTLQIITKTSRFSYNESSFVQQNSLTNSKEDQLALFRFFETMINLDIPKNAQKMKVRSQYAYSIKEQENKDIIFAFTDEGSRFIHINVFSNKTYYYTQPGYDNVFSAIYYYLRDIKIRFSKEIGYHPVLREFVLAVFN